MSARRWFLVAGFMVACVLAAAAGFWAGFREAWWLSADASALPRASASLTHLRSITAGKPAVAAQALEADVDNGLVRGYDLFEHPLRDWLNPLWGIPPLETYEKSAARLAAYRSEHASPLVTQQTNARYLRGATDEDKAFSELLEEGRRYAQFKIDAMVKRYAPKR